MNADSTPTEREAGDVGEVAAVLAAGWSDHWANRPNDHVFDGLAAALAPLIAAREQAARAEAWEQCAKEAHGLGWLHGWALSDLLARNPYCERADTYAEGGDDA